MRKSLMALSLLALSMGSAAAADFSLSIPGLKDGGTAPETMVLNGMDCKGGTISSELAWQGVPAGTKSLALTFYDPDAPTGSGFWHWSVLDIPATATGLPAGAGDSWKNELPKGAKSGIRISATHPTLALVRQWGAVRTACNSCVTLSRQKNYPISRARPVLSWAFWSTQTKSDEQLSHSNSPAKRDTDNKSVFLRTNVLVCSSGGASRNERNRFSRATASSTSWTPST
jgi:hypothetical protein